MEEALGLRQAYVLLAEANHDYDGHRVHAMHAVRAAFHLLHEEVRRHGTPQMKATMAREGAAMGAAGAAGRRLPGVHERQAASDAQVRLAGDKLAQVRAAMARHKQHRELGHVDHALKEIAVALKVR
jgi:hypothetical protein